MHWRLKVGRAAGVDVFVHWTYLFGPMYIVFLHWYSGLKWPVVGILLVLLFALSACVLLHEFGHSLTARYFGVPTKDIIITPIGGLARLMRYPREPIHEFAIALAGPLMNLAIACLFAMLVVATGETLFIDPSKTDWWQFPKLMFWLNLFLFAFNLIPAYPMDGGRILRSVLATQLRRDMATYIAGFIGQIAATTLIAYGIWSSNLSAMLVGAFVFLAASLEIINARGQTIEQE